MSNNAMLLILVCSFSFLQMDCKDDPPVVPPIIPPDSTSQEFAIQVFEVGAPHTFQITRDVWVFDKNNIWVVGDFYFSDSTVSGGTRESNIIRWDGKKWHQFGGILNSSGIYGITFINDLIGFLSLGGIIKIDNNTLIPQSLSGLTSNPNHSIRKIWASSESNVWGVGLDGFVVHYDGTSWKKLNFPEGWNFGKVIGTASSKYVYANATDFSNPGGSYITEIRLDTVILLNKAPEFDAVTDLYFINDTTLLSVGYSLRMVNITTGKDTFIASFGNDVPNKLAFQSERDYFVLSKNYITGKSSFRHYNGKRFTKIVLPAEMEDVSFRGSHASNNVFAFVGDADNGKSVILLLTR